MVRLVFRPYTQLRRSICTSESLRTSTRVSPGFVLARHRSPSFGSQRVRSGFVRPTRPNPFKGERSREHSDALGLRPLCSRRDHPSRMHPHRGRFTFIAPREFSLIISRRLAHMLDSLVRVSRRVGWDPTSTLRSGPPQVEHRNCFFLFLQRKKLRHLPGGDRSRPGSTVGKRRARHRGTREGNHKNSLTDAPCNRHPVGRGVLLGPPLADLGVAIAIAERLMQESRQLRQSLHAALRAYNQVPGAGTCSTFEGPPV